MSLELTVSAMLDFKKGSVSEAMSKIGARLTVTGTKFVHNVQEIGLAEEAILKGDITTPGYIIVVNLDPTNYVSIRGATGAVDTVRVRPGMVALFESAGANPFAIANVAAAKIEYLMIEQ